MSGEPTVTSEEDRQRRQRICAEAFVDERFVIFLNPCHPHTSPIAFIPRYDEAPLFLRRFIVPFLFDAGGALERESWLSNLPFEVEQRARPVYWRQYLRWRDIESVEIWTETDEQRRQLDEVLERARDEYLDEVRQQRRRMLGE